MEDAIETPAQIVSVASVKRLEVELRKKQFGCFRKNGNLTACDRKESFFWKGNG